MRKINCPIVINGWQEFFESHRIVLMGKIRWSCLCMMYMVSICVPKLLSFVSFSFLLPMICVFFYERKVFKVHVK